MSITLRHGRPAAKLEIFIQGRDSAHVLQKQEALLQAIETLKQTHPAWVGKPKEKNHGDNHDSRK